MLGLDPVVFWKIHPADLEDMNNHFTELEFRRNEVLDILISNLTMVVEGHYAGKKTRPSTFWRLLKNNFSKRENEDVIEARALINSIERFREKGMLLDKDADKVLEDAREIVKNA